MIIVCLNDDIEFMRYSFIVEDALVLVLLLLLLLVLSSLVWWCENNMRLGGCWYVGSCLFFNDDENVFVV